MFKTAVPHFSSGATTTSLNSDEPGASAMNVKTIVDQLCEKPHVPASPHFAERLAQHWRLSDFFELTKPRVMLLAVFTAVVGLISAGGELDAFRALIAVLAIAAGAGAAGALNMWYDADIDAVMTRTAMRPIPRGKVSKVEALVFGTVLGAIAVVVLALATNLTAAALLAGSILFYAIVYTVWLKRSTPQNIVIGGAAGAIPPVIGWAAATGDIGLEPLALFLIIFLWTPPHFWALALNRTDDYARAGVPMLPVVAGRPATTRQILIYSGLLALASELPWILGFAGTAYGAIAAIGGALFLLLSIRLNRSAGVDRHAAQRLFLFSISYLFVLFAALLIDHRTESFSSMRSSHAGRTFGSTHAALLPDTARSACGTFNLSEV
jgi:protoheme IX farnesyltransferase